MMTYRKNRYVYTFINAKISYKKNAMRFSYEESYMAKASVVGFIGLHSLIFIIFKIN